MSVAADLAQMTTMVSRHDYDLAILEPGDYVIIQTDKGTLYVTRVKQTRFNVKIDGERAAAHIAVSGEFGFVAPAAVSVTRDLAVGGRIAVVGDGKSRLLNATIIGIHYPAPERH